jgi:hypothetical protein
MTRRDIVENVERQHAPATRRRGQGRVVTEAQVLSEPDNGRHGALDNAHGQLFFIFGIAARNDPAFYFSG